MYKIFFRLIRCEANYVVTCAISSIINLHFSLAVLLITLMSGDIFDNPGPSYHSSTNDISLSVMHLNIRSKRKTFECIEKTLSDFNILCFIEMHLHNDGPNEDNSKCTI